MLKKEEGEKVKVLNLFLNCDVGRSVRSTDGLFNKPCWLSRGSAELESYNTIF